MSNDALLKKSTSEIMVVDDDLSSLRLLSDILGKHGYQVRPASSGSLALRSIALEAPDLILLDIKMPDMDGYEVCRLLKADEKSRKIPVIFISALGKTAEKVLGFKAGAVDFITKPYEAQEVLARVRTHLRLRELTYHLEQEVTKRTAELTVTNDRLHQEILERKRVEQRLRNYAETQEVLVREVNHRVKNNLSAIIGMLHMEEDRAQAEGAIQYLPTLQDLIWRIDGLATVHSLLSASGWQPLEVDELCRQVVETVLRGVPLGRRMRVKVMPSKIQINSNQAHHLTLIINELATNSMKYAFGSRDEANITIEFHQHENSLTIIFRDDGPGYPKSILQDNSEFSTIGFELISGIASRSLNGTVDFGNDDGAFTRIVFNNELN